MRLRHLSVAALGIFISSLISERAVAQGWADQLFESRSHDFGYVARNGKYEHEFVLRNTLNRRVHISSATPSCGVCTVAKPEKEWLEPGESSVLRASINTRTVQGLKEVSITVVFDQPSYATTRLLLKCFARTDVVFSENEVSFGVVRRGAAASKTINIEYAGDTKWRIDGAAAKHPAIDTELEETHRGNGLVGYRLKVSLKPDADPGMIRDRIVLGVNDAYNKSGIEIALNATVRADVSLSASNLDIGTVAPGSTTTRQVMVRGVRPFKIVDIQGDEGPIDISKPDDAKQLHILTVTLHAGETAGAISQDFEIATDMDGEPPLKLTVSAKLAAKPSPSQTAN